MDQINEAPERVGVGGRRHAVPKVEDVPVAAVRLDQHAIRLSLDHVPRRRQHGRIQVALHARLRPHAPPRHGERGAPVHADHVAARASHQPEQLPRPHAEVDRRNGQVRQAVEETAHVRQHRSLVRVRTQRSDPGVEHLQRLRAGVDLRAEMRQHDGDEGPHQRIPHVGFAQHQRLRALVRPRRAAFDEVARQRERRAREPQEGNLQLLTQQPDRIQHVGHVGFRLERTEPPDVGRRTDGFVDHRSHPGLDPDGDAHGRQRHHDVAEQDRSVDGHPPERLHRDLRDQVGVQARVEDVAVPTHLEILGKVAPGLAHEPDRCSIHRLTPARAQEPVGGGEVAHPHRIRTLVVRTGVTGS